MKRLQHRTFLVPAIAVFGATLALAAPAPETTKDVIKDRAGFIPQRKYQSLPGNTIGVLVSNVAPMMNQEGRSGPPDAMAFSANGGSYRWIYVPVENKPLISGLQVKVGEKGEKTKIYPSLSMANPQTVKQWQIDVPYALVEFEVNDNLGAPPEEGFVATKMRRLDDTKDYPFKVAEIVTDLQKRYKLALQDQQKAITAAFDDIQKTALKDRKLTGPRETNEMFYITWLPDKERLRVHFRTTISDGAFQFGGGIERPRPIPLPVPPAKEGKGQELGALRPPPPPRERPAFRFGTVVGLELGMAFEVSKHGKIDSVLTLPIQTFTREIPPPPGVGPGAPVDPRLPPRRSPFGVRDCVARRRHTPQSACLFLSSSVTPGTPSRPPTLPSLLVRWRR
jgi:hypothetical protein